LTREPDGTVDTAELLWAGFALQHATSETMLHDDAVIHDAMPGTGGKTLQPSCISNVSSQHSSENWQLRRPGRLHSWSGRPSCSRSYAPSKRPISVSWSRDARRRASWRAWLLLGVGPLLPGPRSPEMLGGYPSVGKRGEIILWSGGGNYPHAGGTRPFGTVLQICRAWLSGRLRLQKMGDPLWTDAGHSHTG
jgi:hypothetical protein